MANKILVVEHRSAVKEKLREFLHGHDLEFAESGAAALESARVSHPSIIVIDVKMPNSTGFEICGKLQAISETRDIPVIFLAASHGDTSSATEASEFIVKPVDFPTLKKRIERLLVEHEGIREFREVYSEIMAWLVTDPTQDLTAVEAEELASAGFPVKAKAQPQPVAKRAAEYATLVATGLSTTQAAHRLGVNTSRIRQRLLKHPPTLYGIRRDNEWVLPAFQFQQKGLVPNIQKVIPKLDSALDAVAIYRWFINPNPDLVHDDQTVSPLNWLRQGLAWKNAADLANDL